MRLASYLFLAACTGVLSAEPSKFTEVVEPARSGIYLGDIIPTEREQLYRQRMVDVDFADMEVSEVIRGLARSANINFIMPKLSEDPKLTLRMQMNPFAALERVVEAQGMGLVRKDNVWLLQQVRKDHLMPKTYRLQNIHLDREFTFREKNAGAGGIQNTFNPNTGVSSATSAFDRVTNPVSNTMPRAASDRSSSSSPILDNLERILDVGIRNALDPKAEKFELNNEQSAGGRTEGKQVGQQMFSYDPDSNALFVLATEQQHQWVSEYLSAIDVATYNIEIKVLFLSSNANPTKTLGVNWANTLGNGVNISATGPTTNQDNADGTSNSRVGPISLGSVRNPDLGLSTAILSASALNVTLQALLGNSDTSTNRYPVVNTYNNREVVIASTTNVPVVASTNTTQVQTSGTNVASGSTNQATIINEEVGTVVRILPRVIQGGVIALNVNIDVTNVLGFKMIQSNEYPLISQTASTTEVKLQSGFTAVIGGLEEMISKDSVSKVPLLGDIPFFGFGFKSISKSQQKSNLSLLITARIVNERGEDMFPQKTASSEEPKQVDLDGPKPTAPKVEVVPAPILQAKPVEVPSPQKVVSQTASASRKKSKPDTRKSEPAAESPPPAIAKSEAIVPATEPVQAVSEKPAGVTLSAPPSRESTIIALPQEESPLATTAQAPLASPKSSLVRIESPPQPDTAISGKAAMPGLPTEVGQPAAIVPAPVAAPTPQPPPVLVATSPAPTPKTEAPPTDSRPITIPESVPPPMDVSKTSVGMMTPPRPVYTSPKVKSGPSEQSWTVDIETGAVPVVSSTLRIEHLDDAGLKVSRIIARGGRGAARISGKYFVSPGVTYRLIASATDASGLRTERDAGTFTIPR